jgi:hypothetical protein
MTTLGAVGAPFERRRPHGFLEALRITIFGWRKQEQAQYRGASIPTHERVYRAEGGLVEHSFRILPSDVPLAIRASIARHRVEPRSGVICDPCA